MSSMREGDKITGGRSEAAFSETRTRGVVGFDERSDTRELACLVACDDNDTRCNLKRCAVKRGTEHTNRANDQTRYGSLASSIRLPVGGSR